MILDLGEYKIVTDSMQFIVQKKKVVQASRLTKPENVGNVIFENYAYYGTLDNALDYVAKRAFLDSDDLVVIKRSLDALRVTIEGFTEELNVNVRD